MTTYGIPSSNLISLLYKKYIGVIDGNPFTTLYETLPVNNVKNVLYSDIWADAIPSTAPPYAGWTSSAIGTGTVYTNVAYPVLKYST